MLIRISGGASGIKEYLEHGQKQDRFYSRDELDERVILDGDLNFTNDIINLMDNDKNKYFHITLAFKEDYIEPDVLEKINQDFKQYFLSGYSEHEINYYAEAHLPKIKSYVSLADGKLVERKPHIHIVIPRLSLVDGLSFNPSIKHIEKYIDSFQEHINAKYGLASPKDNLRINFNNTSDAISRYTGDIFPSIGRNQKLAVLDLIVKHNPTNTKQLHKLLAQNGYEVKVRNKNDADKSYLNIKLKKSIDASYKGINLKDYVFSNEFLNLPLEAKLAKLNAEQSNKYAQQSSSKKTSATHQKNMQEWLNIKALEIRFINRNASKQEKIIYNQLSPANKITFLKNKQQTHYKEQINFLESNQDERNTNTRDIISFIRTNDAIIDDLKKDITRIGNIKIGNNTAIIRDAIIRTGKERYRTDISNSEANQPHTAKNSVIDEINEQSEKNEQQQKFKNHLHELNSNLHADILLELVAKTHGVQQKLYLITKSKDGSDRIKCGNRNLSMVDFCTKELNLSFKHAVGLLDNAYNMQNDINRVRGWSIKQDIYLREQYKE